MTPSKGGPIFFLGCKLIICSKPLICSCHYIQYLLLILDVPFISCPRFLALCCPPMSVYLFINCSFFHSLFPSVFHSFLTILSSSFYSMMLPPPPPFIREAHSSLWSLQKKISSFTLPPTCHCLRQLLHFNHRHWCLHRLRLR